MPQMPHARINVIVSMLASVSKHLDKLLSVYRKVKRGPNKKHWLTQCLPETRAMR